MDWHDILLLASPFVTAAAAAVASWQTINYRMGQITATQSAHESRISTLEHDVRYAHRRINDISGRAHRVSD
jgi:hypothetical protein